MRLLGFSSAIFLTKIYSRPAQRMTGKKAMEVNRTNDWNTRSADRPAPSARSNA